MSPAVRSPHPPLYRRSHNHSRSVRSMRGDYERRQSCAEYNAGCQPCAHPAPSCTHRRTPLPSDSFPPTTRRDENIRPMCVPGHHTVVVQKTPITCNPWQPRLGTTAPLRTQARIVTQVTVLQSEVYTALITQPDLLILVTSACNSRPVLCPHLLELYTEHQCAMAHTPPPYTPHSIP